MHVRLGDKQGDLDSLQVSLSLCLSPSVSLSLCLAFFLPLSLFLSLFLSLSLSLSLCLSVCLSVSLCRGSHSTCCKPEEACPPFPSWEQQLPVCTRFFVPDILFASSPLPPSLKLPLLT
jgi:hypothetical protein